MFVLVMTGAIGLFLGYQSIPTLHHYGLHFFTEAQWQPELNKIGIAAVLVGTVEVALVAMVVGFPLALMSPSSSPTTRRSGSRRWLVSAVDLMAAVPSIIYGLWGFFLLQPQAIDRRPVAEPALRLDSRSSTSTPTRMPPCGSSRAIRARRSSPASPCP